MGNACFFAATGGEGGGASGAANDKKEKEGEESKEGKETDEETITLKKSEYEEMLKNKFAEGARKATQGKLGNEDNKEKKDEAINDVAQLKIELELLKAEKIAGKLGVKPDYQEDLVALVLGKGLELTEENIKKEADKHKEWLKASDEGEKGGVRKLGSTEGEDNPPKDDEKTQARRLWGLD
ncbi:MAG TPA: hypothetical protein GXZ48_03005 [Acholeplasmataceae bacterium]|nr:hypothetical protein [Acholeplasmataceae bacterium]